MLFGFVVGFFGFDVVVGDWKVGLGGVLSDVRRFSWNGRVEFVSDLCDVLAGTMVTRIDFSSCKFRNWRMISRL